MKSSRPLGLDPKAPAGIDKSPHIQGVFVAPAPEADLGIPMQEVLKKQGLLASSQDTPEASRPGDDGGALDSLRETSPVYNETGPQTNTNVNTGNQTSRVVIDQSEGRPPFALRSAIVISLDLIDQSPYQPRLVFDPDAIGSLADTIEDAGLNNPIIVRLKKDGRYELVAGERRLRAFQLLRKTEIAAFVREMSDAEAAVMAITDNDAREDLSDYERGRSYHRLLTDKIVQNNLEISRRVGRSMSTVSRCLAFLKLPAEVISMLDNKPNLIGTKVVSDFVALTEEGYKELVVAAVIKIREKKMSQESALNWLKSEVRRKKYPSAPQPTRQLKYGGRSMADVKIDGRKLILQCPKDMSPEQLLKTIESVLNNTEPGS